MMKQSRHRTSLFVDVILVAGLAVIWLAFAPARIGGQASYVMVNGNSMEPGYHSGDLVIVRKASAYQVGDVVTYRDADMSAYVIHRIVGIQQERFVLKGDNNTWIDAYHPTHNEIIGKQWIHAPKFGRVMQWLRMPINLALSILSLGGVYMTNMIVQADQKKKGKRIPSTNLGGILEGALYLLGFLSLIFLGLGIFAFTRPLIRAADNIPYQQESNYFYSATGTPGVYDAELVRSGEPVFPKLTCFLNVGLTYSLLGNEFSATGGTHQMNARVVDEQSGWQRTIPLVPQTAFTGNSYFTMATLDLCQVQSLVTMVEQETGMRASAYTVEIVTDVAFTTTVAGQTISDTFNPSLVFKFDKVHLYLANQNSEVDPLHTSKQGRAPSTAIQTNTLPLLGWAPTVLSIRVVSLLGLALSLGGLAIVGLYVYNTARESQEARIRLRYGTLLMDVYERSLDASLPVIDVASIDDLAKMAERQNTMILHMTLNFLHYYLVQSNGALYRYVVTSKPSLPAPEPARQELFTYPVSNVDPQPTGYVIDASSLETGKKQFVDAEILKKIRL